MDQLPYEQRLLNCGLVSLELRRLRKDLALCYQIVNGLVALDFKLFFLPQISITELGVTVKNFKYANFPMLLPEPTFFQCVHVVPLWNSLTDEVILCGNYYLFCKKIECIDLSVHLKRHWDVQFEFNNS